MLRITEKRVGQVLLGLEIRVGLWRVVGQAVDAEAGGRERGVRVAEEADLGRAYGRSQLIQNLLMR